MGWRWRSSSEENGTMTQINPRRVTARIEGDCVVFLIGMRINKPWKLHK